MCFAQLSIEKVHSHRNVYVEEFRQGDTLWHRLKMRVASGQSVEDAKAELKSLGHGNILVAPQNRLKN